MRLNPGAPLSTEHPVEVPTSQLAPATLRTVVEDFCTRDGTDYGAVELDLEDKVDRVLRQLKAGDAHLIFESTTETLRIVDTPEIRRIRAFATD